MDFSVHLAVAMSGAVALAISAAEARAFAYATVPAGPPAAGLEAYKDAAAKLQQAIGEPGARTDLPGADDPAFRHFTDQAAALGDVLGTKALPVAVDTFDPICGPATRVLAAYELAGAAQAIPKIAADEQARATAQLVERNLTRYFDQLLPLMVFSGHCQAMHMPAFEAFAALLPAAQWTDARKDGVEKIRTGLFQTTLGLLGIACDPAIGEARQKTVLGALAKDAPLIAPALTLEARRELLDVIRYSTNTLTRADPAAVGEIVAGLQDRSCGSLCSH